MYEEFFGLNRPPFRITPDTSLFYEGGHRGDILGALAYAVHRGEGIIKVVGEVGSGKTMLCRMLQHQLPDTVEIIYIANPSVSPEDIHFVIATELKFSISKDASKHELVNQLQRYLLKRHMENRQVVLFVEEAQGMPIETLEEIRLLSNLETDEHKLLQIILFGQPELDQNLASSSIRQLRERITHDFNLAPLGAAEIHQYLNFRMREVGYTGPELINEKLSAHIASVSEGLMRRINILADKMLLAAFAEGTHTLTDKHLKAAIKDSSFSATNLSRGPGQRSMLLWIISILLLLLLITGILLLVNSGLISSKTETVSVPDENRQILQTPETAVTSTMLQPPQSPTGNLPAGPKNIQPENVTDTSTELQTQLSEQASENPLNDYAVEAESTQQADALAMAIKKNSNARLSQQQNHEQEPENAVATIPVTEAVKAEKKPLTLSQGTPPPVLNAINWLENKLADSQFWLKNADSQGVSIQVMMRSSNAADELVEFLRHDWPLDLSKTHVYQVNVKGKSIFRVFYGEFNSITSGQKGIEQLPQMVKVNAPYLQSIYRMQETLL